MSDAVSIHVPVAGILGHSVTVGGDELHVHWEAVQVPSPQARPQAPQLRASALRSTHVHPVTGSLGHIMIVGDDELHVQWEAVQIPSPQAWPQAPQLRASVLTSTHDDPHMVWLQSELDEPQAARTTSRTLARIRAWEVLWEAPRASPPPLSIAPFARAQRDGRQLNVREAVQVRRLIRDGPSPQAATAPAGQLLETARCGLGPPAFRIC